MSCLSPVVVECTVVVILVCSIFCFMFLCVFCLISLNVFAFFIFLRPGKSFKKYKSLQLGPTMLVRLLHGFQTYARLAVVGELCKLTVSFSETKI